jgi:NADH-quinone oxidoreductase subunit K
MIPAGHFFVVAAVLFVLGAAAFFLKKDLVMQFMSVEVMLNAANLAFLALAPRAQAAEAQAVVLFVITVAAAEAAVGLAIVIAVFRTRATVSVDEVQALRDS